MKAVRPMTTAAVRKKAWMTTLWSKNVTRTPTVYASTTVKAARRIKLIGVSFLLM